MPFETGETDPTPWSIEKDVALVVVHLSDDVLPAMILRGEAVSVQVGCGGVAIVTVVAQVVCPPGPETVIVYVVVFATDTDFEPDLTGETDPTA